MTALLQKKKLSSSKNSETTTLFDVELQPISQNSTPPSYSLPPPNPFNNFPSSPPSTSPIYYPLPPQSTVGVVSVNPYLTGGVQSQVPVPQVVQGQVQGQPQGLVPQYYGGYLPQPQMVSQYIPQVYPNSMLFPTQNFSSSVLSQIDMQPNVAQIPLYPVIESQHQLKQQQQQQQPYEAFLPVNYPNIEQSLQNSNKEPIGQFSSKESNNNTREKTKSTSTREKTKSTKEKEPIDSSLDQVMTKRCQRCSIYYVESDLAQAENKTPCKYHPGSFKTGYSSTLISGARIQYWTCCKSSHRNDPGCKSGKHIEDPHMSAVQTRNNNPTQPQAQVGVLIDFAPAASEQQPKESEKESTKPEKPRNIIRHYVTDADTLIGISFRYHVSPHSIRQLNRMPNDDVQGFSKLYIPRKGQQVNFSEIESDSEEEADAPPQNLSESERQLFEKRMLMKLRAQTGISNEEAKFYLTMYGWSFSSALKEYQEDIDWEKNHKRIPARKCK